MKTFTKRILLIEDNPDDEFLTIDALRENNIVNPVDVVRDGAEALEYIFCEGRYAGRDLNALPALTLLDLNLPIISGIEVLRQIRAHARTKLLTVVVLTTSTEQEDLVRSYRLGASSFVCKPVEMDAFIEAVGKLGSYWLDINKNAH